MKNENALQAEIIKEEKKPNYELVKIDENKFVALQNCEADLKKIVEENPFIKVTDKATLKIAKEREANLRNARLGLRTTGKSESQEKTLYNMLAKAKEFVKESIDLLVLIPSVPESKLSEEIKAFEQKEELAKQKAKEEKEKRDSEIKEKINHAGDALAYLIESMIFETIEESERNFVQTAKVDKSEFKEFDFMFEELLEERTEEFDAKVLQLKEAEKNRLENLKKDQEAKINTLIIEAQEAIEVYTKHPEQKELTQHIKDIFEIDFDFGEQAEKFEQEKEKFTNKASERIKQIEAEILRDEKYRVFELGEGLLDLIHQITIDNLEDTETTVKEALEQPHLEQVQAEMDKLREKVEKALKEKRDSLNDELEKRKKGAKKLQEEKDKTTRMRIKLLEKVGFVLNGGFWRAENYSFTLKDIEEMTEEKQSEVISEMKKNKEYAEKEALRQKRIKADKGRMLDLFISIEDALELKSVNLENNESVLFLGDLVESLKESINELKSKINEF